MSLSMSQLPANATLLVEAVLAELPPGENPYALLLTSLSSIFFWQQPSSFPEQVIALSVIFGLYVTSFPSPLRLGPESLSRRIMLVVATSLFHKFGSDFCVFRVAKTTRGTYLHPHLSNVWQFCTILFLAGELPAHLFTSFVADAGRIVMQVYIWGVYARNERKNLPFLIVWNVFIWFPSWLSGWAAVSLPLDSGDSRGEPG